MKSQHGSRLATAFRILVAMPILLSMVFPSALGLSKGPTNSGNDLTATLSFSSAPIVGRAAELVLTVTSAKTAEIQAEITLPAGLLLVAGDLKASGTVGEGPGWKHAIVVKVAAAGEYKINVQVNAGVLGSSATDLYLASTETNASVGQVPVKAPAPLTLTPSERTAGEGNAVTILPSPDVEFTNSQEDLDGPQPTNVQAADVPLQTEEAKEKVWPREGLGIASADYPIQFEKTEAGAVEDANNLRVIPQDSPELRQVNFTNSIFLPAVGNPSGASPLALVGPDLIVVDMWSASNPLMINEYNSVYFQVRNQGTTAITTPFRIILWIGGSYIESWYMDTLGIGQYATSFINIYISTAALWSVQVTVDYNNNVAEAVETNNTRVESWVWMSSGKDVMVEDLYATTNPLLGGEWETLYIALRNVGNTAITETFYTRLYVAGIQVGYWYTAGLASQAVTYGGVTLSKLPGTYAISGYTDVTGVVAEASEANNSRIESWTWNYSGGVDLTTTDIYSNTLPLTINTAETIIWSVSNIGTTAAYVTGGEPVSGLSVVGTQPGGSVKVTWDNALNTPSQISGDLAISAPVGQPELAAANFFDTFGGLYGMQDARQELSKINLKSDDLGMQHVRYQQKYQGLEVYGQQLIVHVAKDGRVASTNGSFVPNIALSITPDVTAETALDAARHAAQAPNAEKLEAAKLMIYPMGADAHLAWSVRMTVDDLPYRAFVDAHTGQVLDATSEIMDARNRNTYTAGGGTALPGTLILNEASTSSTDAVAWTTHYNTGLVYDYWKNTFGRDSYNGAGATMVSTVHYGYKYNNAFWNGAQMVYGDGDGVAFKSLGLGLDVVGHELTHGVVSSVGGLTYNRQSGALNESVADFFAAMIDRADWQIGEDVYTPATAGDALRDMSNPPVRSQPDHMANFRDYSATTVCDNSNDQCGVHYNSGIPNKAFYLMSDGGLFHSIQVYGLGRAKTERIVWRALDVYFVPSTTFAQARSWTVTAANDIFGVRSAESHTVEDAFAAVGVGGQSGFYVDIYLDNSLTTWWWITELKPGWAIRGGYIKTYTVAGSHTIKILADSLNHIWETNESNNNRTELWVWN